MLRVAHPVLLLVPLLFAGCAASTPPPAEAPASPGRVARLFPLGEGHSWHYRGTLLGEPVDRTIRITGREDGWWIDSEGERYRVDREGLRTPSRYLLREPATPGTQWRSIVSFGSIERYEVTAQGLSVRVPAGRFDGCVQVRSHERHDPETLLVKEDVYCPDVGLVKMVVWADVAGRGRVRQASLELVEAEVGTAGDGGGDASGTGGDGAETGGAAR